MQGTVVTVIIVSVAIALALALAIYLSSMVSLYTDVERLEIATKSIVRLDNGTYRITLSISNKGTREIHVSSLLINDKPIEKYASSFSIGQRDINPEEKTELTILLNLEPGTALELSAVTNKGIKYSTTVRLP